MSAVDERSAHLDRSAWKRGPWDQEPDDRIEWRDEATGLPCLMVRNSGGAWCGYVAVSPGHPWHGVDYSGSYAKDGETYVNSPVEVECHGGLTYASKCQEGGKICHVAKPGEADDVWWFGFDCSHSGDASPRDGERWGSGWDWGNAYRYEAYVRRNVTEMARQIAAVAA